MPLGDTQYQRSTTQGYLSAYRATWALPVHHAPVVGNHKYLVPYATDYFSYFGRRAGDPRKGYYSFNLGRWHTIVLNDSGCSYIGGCERRSLELTPCYPAAGLGNPVQHQHRPTPTAGQ